MAYPFSPNVCLRDLFERLRREYGDRFQVTEVRLRGPRGETAIRGMTLETAGVIRTAYLPEIGDADALGPTTGRSVLVQLGLDPAPYGFHLGGYDDDDDD